LSTSGYDGSYYIQRSLNYQTNIKREIFTSGKEITETFVISGDINRNDIQVPNGSKLFIVPNNNEASEKFKDLSQGHWLKYETGSNSFVWQQSKGSLSVLREFIDDKSYTKAYKEEAMIKLTNTSKIIIISDTAGMGKSTILTHLALQIKKDPSNSDLWLIRINLNDYTDKLKELKEKIVIKELDLDSLVEFLSRDLLNISDPFEQKLIKHCITMGKSIVMFDGFDEISPTYKDLVIGLLKILSKTQIRQVWITTRPNMR